MSDAAADQAIITFNENLLVYFQLYDEISAWPDYFLTQRGSSEMTDSQKDYIKKNWPAADHFRRTIKRLATSVPAFTWDGKNQAAVDKMTEISARPMWEGAQTLQGVMADWRAWLFVGAATYVKLPLVNGKVKPERMPPYYARLEMSQNSRKEIIGFNFRYQVGTAGIFTSNASLSAMITEQITANSWTVNEKPQGDFIKSGIDFIPVAYMAWEPRESSAIGVPLSERVIQKVLHVYSVGVDKRMANKLSGFPVGVGTNVTGLPTAIPPGTNLSLNDKSPTQKADFKFANPIINMQDGLNLEYDQALRELSETAYLPFEGKEGAGSAQPASGRAMQMLSAGQIAYRTQFILAEKSFLEDMAYKCLRIEGVKVERGDVTAKYDGFGEDQRSVLEKATLLFGQGLVHEALKVLGYDQEHIQAILDLDKETMALKLTEPIAGAAKRANQPDAPVKVTDTAPM